MIAAVVVVSFDDKVSVTVNHFDIIEVLYHRLKISVAGNEVTTVNVAVPSSASACHKVIASFETVFERVFQISPRFLVLKVNFFVDFIVGDVFFASPTVFVGINSKEKIPCFIEFFCNFRYRRKARFLLSFSSVFSLEKF